MNLLYNIRDGLAETISLNQEKVDAQLAEVCQKKELHTMWREISDELKIHRQELTDAATQESLENKICKVEDRITRAMKVCAKESEVTKDFERAAERSKLLQN